MSVSRSRHATVVVLIPIEVDGLLLVTEVDAEECTSVFMQVVIVLEFGFHILDLVRVRR
jgi:hypothetical protein